MRSPPNQQKAALLSPRAQGEGYTCLPGNYLPGFFHAQTLYSDGQGILENVLFPGFTVKAALAISTEHWLSVDWQVSI